MIPTVPFPAIGQRDIKPIRIGGGRSPGISLIAIVRVFYIFLSVGKNGDSEIVFQPWNCFFFKKKIPQAGVYGGCDYGIKEILQHIPAP
jgi:hypothetical protein